MVGLARSLVMLDENLLTGFRANPSTKSCHVNSHIFSASGSAKLRTWQKYENIGHTFNHVVTDSTFIMNIRLMIFPSQFKISIARLDNRQ